MQNGSAASTWVKTGAGDVVLTGSSPNSYTGLTRLFGGWLIIEKNGALGGAGSDSVASGNFFQNSLSASTLAFRAPATSPSGYSYTTWEVLNTEGLGNGGLGQIDNLGGANTFAGAIALGGPTVAGIIQSNIGVSVGSLEVAGGLYARGSTGVRNISKTGVGKLVLSGTGATAATNNPIVVPLDGSSFTITAGAVDLRGATPATKVLPSFFTWTVNSGATLQTTGGTFDPAGVSIFGGGSFIFAGGVTNIGALGVTGAATVTPGGAKVLRTDQLNILSNGKVDLADNDAIVNYTGAASPIGSWTGSSYSGLLGSIRAGRNAGAWNASGLTTSQPDAAAGMTALGIAEASETLGINPTQTALWNGQSVDDTSVLVMYTYAGDATLDGKINIDDYTKIDGGIVGGATGWANGDFNYDGKIDIDDYTIIDDNIASQGAPLNSTIGIGESVVAVPEPGMWGGFVLFSWSLIRRQRRGSLRTYWSVV
jgi:autotransporter-associated beta strand protein